MYSFKIILTNICLHSKKKPPTPQATISNKLKKYQSILRNYLHNSYIFLL